eukprot:TRINITY_DN4727_c0_g1_i7.p2 TRINITY_DN4727_c0_g1~~TRINITY_DN4727_c0_g1_i7.p2  ORF type:complete len:546 (+),score=133.81 TRINITY_DN4727_c0_g1_i7:1048-2685(+)
MNVTKTNFAQTLPIVLDAVRRATFVAFDFEMTGVAAAEQLRNTNLDSVQLRYWKAKESVRRFAAIQLGLCTFSPLGNGKIEAKPFNLHLFPLVVDGALDRRFLFQPSALQFLAEHNFDFNRLIYEGVHYLSHAEERQLAETQRLAAVKKRLREVDTTITAEMQTFYLMHAARIKDFFSEAPTDNTRTLEVNVKFIKYKVYKYLEEKLGNVVTDGRLEVKYDSDSLVNRTKMTLRRMSVEEAAAAAVTPSAPRVEVEPSGARIIFDEIIAKRVPLLTHNGFLDALHIYDKFIGPLPDRAGSFKQAFRGHFPAIYDTKYLVSSSNVLFSAIGPMTDLSTVFKNLWRYKDDEPRIEVAPGFTEYKLSGDPEEVASHEAGYDALITGYSFFKSLQLLRIPYDAKDFTTRMAFFANRFPLGGVKVPFNLSDDGADAYKEASTAMFHVTNKDETATLEEIRKIFEEKYGKVNVYTIFGAAFEYFLIFQRKESAEKLTAEMTSANRDKLRLEVPGRPDSLLLVTTYAAYEEQLQTRVKKEEPETMPEYLELM